MQIYNLKKFLLSFAAILIIISPINAISSPNENLTIQKNSWIIIEENGKIKITTILIFPMNVRASFGSDLIDPKFNLTNINVGYDGEIIENDIEQLIKVHRKVDNYTVITIDTPDGKFKRVESYLAVEGSKNKPGIISFEFELNESLNDSEDFQLNLETYIPLFKGIDYNYIYNMNLLSHKKSTYGILKRLQNLTLNESVYPSSIIYKLNGFNLEMKGTISRDISGMINPLIFNQINIRQIKDYKLDIYENWIIEDKNETHYNIKINVNTRSNSGWPFYHPVIPAMNWIFDTLRKPENFIERPNYSVRSILGINDTGTDPMQGMNIKSCFSCNLSLQEMNDSDVLVDGFFIPNTYPRAENTDVNRTIYIEFDAPKSEFKKISTGVITEYNWISTFYQKKILLLSNDYFFSSTPYTQEYLNEGYRFTKERNLIGNSTELFKQGWYSTPLYLFSNRQNNSIESSNTSIDLLEIKTPETKVENYFENISISKFDANQKLIIASINTKETRSIHSNNDNITIISYLYSVDDPNDIKIKMTKPYKLDSFGSPYDYKSILESQKTEMEFNQLYVYMDNPNNQRDWYALFKINRLNQNKVDFNGDYSSNLSTSLSTLHSEIWEPKEWKLTYEKIFPPGEFSNFIATTVFNMPEGYQIVSVNEGGQLISSNTAKFVSPLYENFTARKVMEIDFISIDEKINKNFFFSKIRLLLLISFAVIIILAILARFKDDLSIIKKLIPFLITILFIQFLNEMPPSIPFSWIIIYLIIFLIIFIFIIRKYSKGLISDVRSSIEK